MMMSSNFSMLSRSCNATASVSGKASGNRFARTSSRRVRGVTLYYMTVMMVLLCGFCSFAVDYGRVQVVKTELRRAADGVARAAAAELPDYNSAISVAKQYSKLNTADGTEIILTPSTDIEFGKWDTKAAKGKEWTKLTGFDISKANCVHVKLERTSARGNAVPTLFAKVLGISSCDASGESYAMLVPAVHVDQSILATSNPFLAGMPKGTLASATNPSSRKIPDVAGSGADPKNSPQAVSMNINEGDALTFDSISGTARHDPNLPYFDPDGELVDIGHNNLTTNYSNNYSSSYTNENGIADMKAPINTLVGVFLDDTTPSGSAAPANLDFSTAESRDFKTLSPKLKQIFFIGDGMNSLGNHQEFVAPKGATRLFLATWDFYEWNNNAGSRNVKVNRPGRIITVK